jgi:predicted ATPase
LSLYCRKSTLVNQIKKPLLELNEYFIEGKFDKLADRPDTVLTSALNSFFGSVLESNARRAGGSDSVHMSMKWRIQDAIGSVGNNVLLEILPNLQKWLMADGGDGVLEGATSSLPGAVTKGIGRSHRLKFMFCKLVGAIACRAHPLILFLDDLQWADEMTVSDAALAACTIRCDSDPLACTLPRYLSSHFSARCDADDDDRP